MRRKRLHERKRKYRRIEKWSRQWLDKQAATYQSLKQAVAADKNRMDVLAFVAAETAKEDYGPATDGDYPVPYVTGERVLDMSAVPEGIDVDGAMKDNGKGEKYLLHRHYRQVSDKVFSYDMPDRYDTEHKLLHLYYRDDEILAKITEQTKILDGRVRENEETMRRIRARMFQELARRKAVLHR